MQKNTYIPYHVHTDDSLLDSCTKAKEYINKCVEDGYKAICFTEHGNVYEWVGKKMYCDKMGIKYLHGVEIYITKTHDEKIRDNMHTILIARNSEGFKEINKLIKLATTKDHTHYKPRISIDEFLGISDNVIKISACVASPLNSIRKGSLDYKTKEVISHYDYLEIQLHNFQEQIDYNNWLYDLSQKMNIPLIVGTDFHSISKYKGECRAVLQLSKKIGYSLESSLDLSYKTFEELVDMAKVQNCKIPLNIIIEALKRTNDLYDLCDDIVLDKSFKYPVLSDDDEAYIEKQLNELYKQKCDSGLIDKNDIRYIPRLREEMRVFKKLGMCSFMAYMGNLVRWCRANDIPTSPNRGSVGGSLVAFVLDIIDVDPIRWNTIFSRFANEDREELGDIDLDFIPRQRPLVFQHIKDEMPPDKTARILSFGTIAKLNCIEIICKGLKEKWFAEHTELNKDKDENKCPYSLAMEKEIKKEFSDNEEKARKKYKDVFYYYDGLLGANIQQQYHNAGIIVSPVTLTDNYGTFCGVDSDGNDIDILQIDMDMAHDVCLVKYDILGLNTLGIIDDAYKMAGLKFPRMNEVDFTDKAVFDDIKEYPIGVFQFESAKSHSYLVKYDIQTINDITLCNASLRPSGESYRDRLMNHEFNHNPSKEIDDLLAENRGFLIYQEDTIKFLTNICGLSGSKADNVRRAIGHKDFDRLNAALPEILDGYCNHSKEPREVAEKEAKQFLQIIEDSASYQFGFNHSTGYSLLAYICGWLRHYHTIEFITSYLKNVEKMEDFTNGESLAKFKGIEIKPPKFRHSKGDYFCDKNTNSIYKGIGSVKFLNSAVADELFELRDNSYSSFIDLLADIKANVSMNNRQLEILIKLDFFSEFGGIDYLLKCVEYFSLFNEKKSIKKDKLAELDISETLIRPFAAKETETRVDEIDCLAYAKSIGLDESDLQDCVKYKRTADGRIPNGYSTKLMQKKYKISYEKMLEYSTHTVYGQFSEIDNMGLVKNLCKSIENKPTKKRDLISYQLEYLGYIDVKGEQYKGYYVVTDINTKGTPKITAYVLLNGNTTHFKIDKKFFNKQPLKVGDVIKMNSAYKKKKAVPVEKDANGKVTKWGESDIEEWWTNDYKVVR